MPFSLTATLIAIPAISADLHVSATLVSWIAASFILSNLIALLPSGRVADSRGRKRVHITGACIFFCSCVLAARASSIEFLLFYRVLQGIGAALSFSTGMAIIGSIYKEKGRASAIGWIVSAVYLGMACGPSLGGWLTELFGWRSVFYMPLPFTLVSLTLLLLFVKGEWKNDNARAIDWLGAAIFGLCSITFFIAMNYLPRSISWVSLLFMLIFLRIFIRHSERITAPLINFRLLWKNQKFSRALLAAIAMYGGYFGMAFFLSLYLQYNRGFTAADAGKLIMIQAICMMFIAPLAGKLAEKVRPSLLSGIGSLSAAFGCALLLFLSNTTPIWVIQLFMVFQGIGFGFFSTPNSETALGSVEEANLGISSALLNWGRLMGQLISSAIVALLTTNTIGSDKIEEAHFQSLLIITRIDIVIAMLLMLVAAWLSSSIYRQFPPRQDITSKAPETVSSGG